jgi:NADH-quinone oxidoreductase subunit L
VFTAFLTSFYMFRLWFMTFFGKYRGEAEAQADEHTRAGTAPHGHEHGHGIHESPAVMLVPLVILAILSIFGGWIGSNRFDRFLSPSLHDEAATSSLPQAAGATMPLEQHREEGRSEFLLTSISVTAAAFGLYLAWLLYWKRPELPQRIAEGLGGLYRAVANKYYVDELYGVLFIKPLIDGSRSILWHGIDQGVIDATLDNSAAGAREVSDSVRHMQSGNLRSYAGWIALGAAAVIAYMIWMGTR